MLPAAARLRRSDEFAAAIRRGRRARRGHLVIHLGVGQPNDPARAGFVVSRAVGGAVARNLVTRRLRHLMAERLDRWPSGSLIVLRALPGAAQVPFLTLANDVDAGLARLMSKART